MKALQRDQRAVRRVGFVGLGNMGEGMATNLAKTGLPLSVLDMRAEPVQRLVAAGARAARDVQDLAQHSDIVCLAVFDEAQVRELWAPASGAPGLRDTLESGAIVVIHSTVPPSLTQDLAADSALRGIAILDAPMTGGADTAARAGRLTFFVGGDEAVLQAALPVLQAMSIHQFHVGAVGAGSMTKILSNYMAISNTLVVREALRLVRACGVDEERFLSVVNTGAVGASWATQNWGHIREQEAHYTTGRAGMVSMAAKDLQLSRELAQAREVAMPALDLLLDRVIPDLGDRGLTHH